MTERIPNPSEYTRLLEQQDAERAAAQAKREEVNEEQGAARWERYKDKIRRRVAERAEQRQLEADAIAAMSPQELYGFMKRVPTPDLAPKLEPREMIAIQDIRTDEAKARNRAREQQERDAGVPEAQAAWAADEQAIRDTRAAVREQCREAERAAAEAQREALGATRPLPHIGVAAGGDDDMRIPFERRPVTDPREAKRLALQSIAASRQARPLLLRKPQPALSPSAQHYLEEEIRWQAFLRRRAGRRSGQDVLDLMKAKRARLGPSPRAKATIKCVTRRGTGRLQSGTVCPLCKGTGRVAASASSAMAGPVGLPNVEAPGGGGAGASEGGGMSGGFNSAKADLERAKAMRARIHGSDPTPQAGYSDRELDRLGKEGKALKMKNGTYAYPILNLADLANALASYKANPIAGLRAWIIKRAILLGLVEQLPKGWAEPAVKLHPNEVAAGQEP
jgi:hypothetical protein